MRAFVLLAFLLLFDLEMFPAFAASSSNSPDQIASATNQQTASCGATVADALKQARVALGSNNTGSERAALACLIEAVSRLNTQAVVKTPAADGHPVLAVPSFSGPMQ
jgi:hypothetical protein